jgi:hypothetical protein
MHGSRSKRTHHVTRHNTLIQNTLSTAPPLSIFQKALGTLPEDGNVMTKHVAATIPWLRILICIKGSLRDAYISRSALNGLSTFRMVNMNWTKCTRNKVTEQTDFSCCTLQYQRPAGVKCYFKLYYSRRSAHVSCERNCDKKAEEQISSVDIGDRWTAGVQWTEVPVRPTHQFQSVPHTSSSPSHTSVPVRPIQLHCT